MIGGAVRWTLLLCVLAGLASSEARADVSPDCESRNLGAGILFVRGIAEINTPPELAYAVVTDYDNLSRFVSAMDSSFVVSRDSTGVLVRQIGTAGLLIRRKIRLALRFEEHPPSTVRFEIIEGDFPSYYGTWRFERCETGTRLVYSVTLRPPAFIPAWMIRPMLERTLCQTLGEVAGECLRRSARQSASASK
jgi:ribosome-associated toxin RatA of RatAB toxin-antitoxin module